MPHSTLSAADAEAPGQPVIADYIIPLEQEAFAAGVDDKLRIQMQRLAHDAGVLAPQAPAGYGGGGADLVGDSVNSSGVIRLPRVVWPGFGLRAHGR